MRIGAIDPGLQGGLALLATDTEHIVSWRASAMPRLAFAMGRGKRHEVVNTTGIRGFFGHVPGFVVIEQQRPMHKQGVTSTFTTGSNYGSLIGLYDWFRPGELEVKERPMLVVVPANVWKKDLMLGPDKEQAVNLAQRLFGARAPPRDGPAEALLIGFWLMREMRDGHARDRRWTDFVVSGKPVGKASAVPEGNGTGRAGAFDWRRTAHLSVAERSPAGRGARGHARPADTVRSPAGD